MAVQLTTLMKIVIAALHLEERGVVPFSKQQLAIEAWRRFPNDFGMESHSQEFPCTARIYSHLDGVKGLVAREYISPSPRGGLILTVQGRELGYDVARANGIVLHHSAPNPAPENGLTPHLNASLHRLLKSTAYDWASQNLYESITYRNAMEFWDIDDTTMGLDLELEFKLFSAQLDQIETCLKAMKSTAIVLDNGREVGLTELALLRHIDTDLHKRWDRNIKVLIARNRKEKTA